MRGAHVMFVVAVRILFLIKLILGTRMHSAGDCVKNNTIKQRVLFHTIDTEFLLPILPVTCYWFEKFVGLFDVSL